MRSSIRLKLVLTFNLFLIALAVIGYLTYRHLDGSRDLSARINSELITRVEDAVQVGSQLNRLRLLELAYIQSTDAAERAAGGRQMSAILADIDSRLAQPAAGFQGDPQPEQLLRLRYNYQTYLLRHEDLITLVDDGRSGEALAAFSASSPAFEALAQDSHDLFRAGDAETLAAGASVSDRLETLQYFMIGGLLAAAALIIAIGHPLSTGIHHRLQGLLEGIRRVSRGELERPIRARGSDEIAAAARAFNDMMGSLRQARDEVGDLHARALAMQEERIALLRGRVAQVVKAQEEERRRVARELHDQAGQVLTVLQLGLSRLQASAPTPQVEQQAASLREIALETMNEVRNLSMDLRPSALDELGLPGTLKDYVETFAQRTGIPASLKVSGTPRRLPAEAEVTLFRIVQEGLTNIAKHSQASEARVALAFANPAVAVEVQDDGVGFDIERALGPEQNRSLGILGIQERCELIGAEFQISSAPGQGTRLAVELKTETASGEDGDGKDSHLRSAA